MRLIIDCCIDTRGHYPAFKAAGISGALRYINGGYPKGVTKNEVNALHAAGFGVGFIFEIWGGSGPVPFAHGDINAQTGTRDGIYSKQYLENLGAPEGTLVWGTIDTDPNLSQAHALVVPYALDFKAAFGGKYRFGIYGSSITDTAAQAADPEIKTWLTQSTGWGGPGGYRSYLAKGSQSLKQRLSSYIGGIDVDVNEVNPAHDDIGLWEAPGMASDPVEAGTIAAAASTKIAPPLAPNSANVEALQSMCNTLHGYAIGVDGSLGPETFGTVTEIVKAPKPA